MNTCFAEDIQELICPVLMDLFLPERMPEEYRTEAVSVSALFTLSFCLCLPPVLWIRIMLVNNFVVDRYGNTREKSLCSPRKALKTSCQRCICQKRIIFLTSSFSVMFYVYKHPGRTDLCILLVLNRFV